MNRRALLALAPGLLVACSGIPLSAIPRLVRLKTQLIDLDPGDVMAAIQTDARLAPPAHAVPMLQVSIRPAQRGGFEPVERSLPMHFERVRVNELGLRTPPPSRHWLAYSLPEASQAELREIQHCFRCIRTERSVNGGGSVSIGIAQHGLAPTDAAWAGSRWETWLRTSRAEGFWEVWSGSVAELVAQAQKGARDRGQEHAPVRRDRALPGV